MRVIIYVADDDEIVCSALSRRLSRRGHLVRSFHSGESVLEALDYDVPDLIFLDLKMQGIDGLETLKQIREITLKPLIILLTAYGTIENAVEAMHLGAYDFLIKTVDFSSVDPVLSRALEFLELRRRIELATSEDQQHYSWDQVIASSPAMAQVLTQIQALASQNVPCIFFEGEVGTGKEFLARVIHFNSARKADPFITVNCNEISGEQLTQKLFGYERGAFPGANRTVPGMLEHVGEGTLFLDEIDKVSFSLQKLILEVFQNRTFVRLGGRDAIPLNCQLMAASTVETDNEDPHQKFHPDLLAFLGTNRVCIPPLRKRSEDIYALALKQIHRFIQEIGKSSVDIAPSVVTLLTNYFYPGNIRELEALVKRALLSSKGNILYPSDFLPSASEGLKSTENSVIRFSFELGKSSLGEIQSMVIREVLRLSEFNKDKAAQFLHVSPSVIEEFLQNSQNSEQANPITHTKA